MAFEVRAMTMNTQNTLQSINNGDFNWPHLDTLKRILVDFDPDQNEPDIFTQKAQNSARFIASHFNDAEDFLANSKQWSLQASQNIDQALHEAWASPRITKLLQKDTESNAVKGLFILGLGKLGGCDLNYSSDVDLIAFFDKDTLPVNAHEGRTHVCDKILKATTQHLCGKTDIQRIWRVDWRLRPDPSVTGLSMSVDAALDFFRFKSAPWRRLAMMKARVVAGDKKAGEKFLSQLSSFVWQRKLDFRTLDEIAAIKQRIKNEHPGLADAASNDAQAVTDNKQFHIKLGAGGIREVEFTINAIQLIWGGRQSALRTTNTIQALNACCELGHISPSEGEILRSGYIWLRRLENAVQFYADRQTHILPDGVDEQALILKAMKLTTWKELDSQLTQHRSAISHIFQNAMRDDEADKARPDWSNKAKNFKTSSAQTEAILETWQAGFLVQGSTPNQTEHLHLLDEQLIAIACDHSDPDFAISKIDAFLQKLPKGGQYLRLMAYNSEVTLDIINALLYSQPAETLLKQSPHVVDLLAELGGSTKFSLTKLEILNKIADRQLESETQLEWIRAWTNEQLFLCYIAALREDGPRQQISARISQIAEHALAICSHLTKHQTGLNEAPLSIVAFGRLGMGQMHPVSDLDLMFLAEGETMDELEIANRFSLRLKSNLDAKMKAGQVWEIDTRLRPSGRSGPPTLRPNSFETHQLQKAKTWEHIALIAARFICGSDESRNFFDQTRCKVITTARDKNQLVMDAASMLGLLRQERITLQNEKEFEIKLTRGGLMEAEFLLHMLVLKHGAEHQQLAQLPYVKIASELETIDPTLDGLDEAISELSSQQFNLRLFGDQNLQSLDKQMWIKRRDTYREIISRLLDQEIFSPAKQAGLKGSKAANYIEQAVKFNA